MTSEPDGTPTVSVLMAAWNAGPSLEAALESVRTQHFGDWELVVVDDASTDGSADVLARFAASEPRVRVLTNATNMGLAASLNDALAVARGELVARMDADDVALPDRLAMQVHFLRAHPEVDILGGAAVAFAPDGTELGRISPRERHEDLLARIFEENPFIHPTVMMRRSVLQRLGGYDTSFRRGQDYDLWLRARGTSRFHNLQEPLIRYARRGQPRWIDAWHSARVIHHALRRDGRQWQSAWYATRPLIATGLDRVARRMRRRRNAS